MPSYYQEALAGGLGEALPIALGLQLRAGKS